MSRRSRTGFPLDELPLFADAKPTELRIANKLLTEMTLGAGRVLTQQGRRGDAFLIVIDGLVDVTRDDGHESKNLGFVSSGDVLGEMSLLHRTARSATATTLTRTTVLTATPREFYSLLEAVPSVGDRVKETATARLRANIAA